MLGWNCSLTIENGPLGATSWADCFACGDSLLFKKEFTVAAMQPGIDKNWRPELTQTNEKYGK